MYFKDKRFVLLDFDDTLCMTRVQCFALENEVLSILGRPAMSSDVHRRTWGQPLQSAISERSPGVDVGAFMEVFHKTMPRYLDAGKLDVIPEENLKLLHQLVNRGISVGILTSRTLEESKHLLSSNHPLTSVVSCFFHKDNCSHHKPDPRVFDAFFSDFDILPKEVIYIGDNPSDAAAASRAGIDFIANLESGLRSVNDFVDYPVLGFISCFVELGD